MLLPLPLADDPTNLAPSSGGQSLLVVIATGVIAIITTALTVWGKKPSRVARAAEAADKAADKAAEAADKTQVQAAQNYKAIVDQLRECRVEVKDQDRVLDIRERRESILQAHIAALYRAWAAGTDLPAPPTLPELP